MERETELKLELDNAKKTVQKLEKQLENLTKPQRALISNMNLQPLINICTEYVETGDYNNERDDLEHYIFETALEMVYGKEVWNYINNKIKK
jgi:flagellar biosynthesis chaperone FliJ